MRRLLIIGLDGGTWDLIEPWAEAGYLPHIKGLMAASAWGVLRAPLQPITAPSWVTFMTGVNQGKHGVYDFVQRRPGEYNLDVANATFIRHPSFFDELGSRGRSVCLLNVPFTFPPHAVNGCMVSGLFAPAVGPGICYPAELWSEILEAAPGYVIQPDFDESRKDPLGDFSGAILRGVRARTAAAQHLISQERWDLAVVVYTATDVASHAFWRHMQEAPESTYGRVIRDVYSLVDEGIGTLLECIDEDTSVMLMSDHGSGPLYRFVQLNKWLADRGWLRFADTTQESGWWKAHLRDGIKRAARGYRRYLPARVRRWLRWRMRKRFELAKARMESLLFATAIDWSRTSAYSLGACGNIFLNLEGREPLGTVAPGDAYCQLREEVRQRLLELRDPETGSRLVARVHRREELYEGPYRELGPDLVIEWQDYRYWGRGRYDVRTDEVFEQPEVWDFSGQPLVGTHRLEGILSVKAPGVRSGKVDQVVRMVDVAPLAFYLLGEPVPADLDGVVPDHLFLASPEVCIGDQDARPQGDPEVYDDGDLSDIAERLKGLGYL